METKTKRIEALKRFLKTAENRKKELLKNKNVLPSAIKSVESRIRHYKMKIESLQETKQEIGGEIEISRGSFENKQEAQS